MAFPDLDRLLSTLNTSGIQISNNPLYQVILQLIKFSRQVQAELEGQIASGGAVVANLSNQPFATNADASIALPNSRQLIAGTGITFDDSVAFQRTIDGGGELPVGTVYSTWINVNPGTLLGYGTWLLMATGVGVPTSDITFTVQ